MVPAYLTWGLSLASCMTKPRNGQYLVRLYVMRTKIHTNDSDEGEANHEDSTSPELVGEPTTRNTADASDDVWRDGHSIKSQR